MDTCTTSYPPISTGLSYARWICFDEVSLIHGEEVEVVCFAPVGDYYIYDPLAPTRSTLPGKTDRVRGRSRKPEAPRSPLLLNTLLALRLAPDALARFASEWGLLGFKRTGDKLPLARGPPDGIEFRDDWFDAIDNLQVTFQVWSAVQNDDRETIRTVIEQARNDPDARFPDDDRAAAIQLVEDFTNAWLGEHTARAVMYGEHNKRFDYFDAPRSLIGAAWLQFAERIGQGSATRKCPCGQWYLIKAKPGNDRYCGKRCRKTFAKRRVRARRLRDERGLTAPEIAHKMKLELALVRE